MTPEQPQLLLLLWKGWVKQSQLLVSTLSLEFDKTPRIIQISGGIKNLSAYKQKLQVYKREHLNILIMYERHFHFHFVVAARLYVNTNLFSHHCMVDLSAALCNVPSIQLTKHNSSLSKPHQVRAARFYKSRYSAMQTACVRHFWSNYFVITMDMIYMFL